MIIMGQWTRVENSNEVFLRVSNSLRKDSRKDSLRKDLWGVSPSDEFIT